MTDPTPQGPRIALVPARGGSKRLPGKNTRPLAGRSLVERAVAAAERSGCFDRILVSTDDPEVEAIASAHPSCEVDARSPELAGDKVKVIEVVLELIDRLELPDNAALAMLLPTCPFRTARHVAEGMAGLTPEWDASISFTGYEFPPTMAVTLAADGGMTPMFDNSPLITGNTRSQDQAPALRPNGAFLAAWAGSLRREGSFYTGRVHGFEMGPFASQDVDTLEDFQLAEAIAAAGLVDPNEE